MIIAALALGALGAGASSTPPLRAMRWLAPDADAATILTRRPVECVRLPQDPDAAWRVEVGRAAFRTPLLLGGQAARAGVACESCHRNGRTDPDFDFPGVSGRPGTADVTTFVFSAHRGDHLDDPRPIPDLGGPKSALKVAQSRHSRDLERFIDGLITQEFDGAEPPPAVLGGLAAYVRAMSPGACPAGGSETVRVEDEIDNARRAVRAARGALARSDTAAAVVMIEAARSALGAIAERYAVVTLAPVRGAIAVADLDLAAALAAVRRAKPSAVGALDVWLAHSGAWAGAARREERLSLYNRDALSAALRRPR